MPTVPRRDPSTVSTAPLPGVRSTLGAPTAAFGGLPSAPDISGLAGHVAQIVEREQQHADQIAVLDADNQLATLQDALLYDPKTGALSRKGQNAFGAPEDVNQGWDKGVAAIEGGLKTDRQQEAFRRAAGARFHQVHETVQRHVSGEIQAYDQQTSTAAIGNRLNDALTNYQDPGAVARSIQETRAIITDFATRNGWAPEEIAAKTTEAESRIHVGVVNQLLANDQDLTAAKYFADHKDAIGGDAQAQVTRALEEGSVRGESQRQAKAIMATRPATITDARVAWEKITDPKVRDATEERVRKAFAEQAEAQRQQRDAMMQRATDIIESTRDFNKIPPAMVATLTLGERSSLREYAAKLVKGVPVETEWTRYYDLKSLASADATRDKFLSTNLLADRPHLADVEFKELVSLQAELRKGTAKAHESLGDYRTFNDIVEGGLKSVGLDPTLVKSPGDKTAINARIALFKRSVTDQLAAVEARTGKKATDDEIQATVDNLLVRGVRLDAKNREQGTAFVFERQVGERMVLKITDVPPGERAKATAALQRAGLPITDAAVIKLYTQRVGHIPTFVPPR